MQISFEMMKIDQEPKLVTKKAKNDDEKVITFSDADLEGVQASHCNATGLHSKKLSALPLNGFTALKH
ncbi:hypothetical protein QJS04_geneDACA016261 [Acorus gramineus]|uniref:Uncharacterized protein n=1 Tax=Acorus gramineus TaxID=55184 RepID=A0AAV9AIB8_ACOGR|nr:hypothetical protein QJS04_geneDACA016261 [Acorus gramineus]